MTATYYHRLFHSTTTTTTTIKEGDDITTVTFFAVKLLKKAMAVVITFFCSKAMEEGDGSYHCFLLFKHREVTQPSSLQHHHIRRQKRKQWQLPLPTSS